MDSLAHTLLLKIVENNNISLVNLMRAGKCVSITPKKLKQLTVGILKKNQKHRKGKMCKHHTKKTETVDCWHSEKKSETQKR